MRALLLAVLLSSACVMPAQMLPLHSGAVRVVRQGQGSPPVVFESGMGEDASTWAAVQPQVSGWTTTLAFDRPGLGTSAPTQAPRDGVTLAQELHEVIHAARLPPPYVLVGHSLGGAVVQLFADRYPAEVAGLVLVDPEDGRVVQRLKAWLSEKQWSDRQKALAQYGAMPPAVQREYDATVADTGAEVAKIGKLPPVPAILLTGMAVDPAFPGNPEEQRLKWELHQELLAQNPKIKQVQIPQSRHYIQNDAPQTVIAAIRSVCLSAKQPSRLPSS